MYIGESYLPSTTNTSNVNVSDLNYCNGVYSGESCLDLDSEESETSVPYTPKKLTKGLISFIIAMSVIFGLPVAGILLYTLWFLVSRLWMKVVGKVGRTQGDRQGKSIELADLSKRAGKAFGNKTKEPGTHRAARENALVINQDDLSDSESLTTADSDSLTTPPPVYSNS